MLYVIALLVVVVAFREWQHDRANQIREDAWRLERAGLLTRIQHPEIVVGEAQPVVIPDEELRDLEPDEIDLVGTVVNNGNGDQD